MIVSDHESRNCSNMAYPKVELAERNGDAIWLGAASLMEMQLNLLLDQLAEEEGQQFLVVGRLVHVFAEALRGGNVVRWKSRRFVPVCSPSPESS